MSGEVGTTPEYEPVIGIEVHAQLLTASKMFCGCDAQYSNAPPNTHVCAVCGGMPGALPVINEKAVDFTILVGLALQSTIAERSKFDRKNYSYPDLPKGYQISQYDMPLCTGGYVDFEVDGVQQRCAITRAHLEEDTGKSTHTAIDGNDVSLVDYNRSGVPLLEIVGEPEIRSPQAARQYVATLRRILMYLGVNDGNLQEGSMRADVNVSMRRPGEALPPTKVEIKNLNSFRAVQRSIEYEIERQTLILHAGGTVAQETRGWSEADEVTVAQRSKEFAHDYRYFPEPDLPALTVDRAAVQRLRGGLPEMPAHRLARYVEQWRLPAVQASVLTDEKPLADYFEHVVQAAPEIEPAIIANWVNGEVLRLLNERHCSPENAPVSPVRLAALLEMVDGEVVSASAAKRVLVEMFESQSPPAEIVDRLDLRQISDRAELERVSREVAAANTKLVERYRSGKTNVFQALVGQVMAKTGGRAHPERTRDIMLRLVEEEDR